MTALTLLLCLGASFRLWHLWLRDDIGQPLRDGADWLSEKLPGKLGDWATQLFSCVFCFGYWISFGVVLSGMTWGHESWWIVLSASLTVSYLLAEIYPRLRTDDRE